MFCYSDEVRKFSYSLIRRNLWYSSIVNGINTNRLVKDVLDLPERIIKLETIKDMTIEKLSRLLSNQTQSTHQTFGYKTSRLETRIRQSIIPGLSNDDAELIHNIYDQLHRKMFNESLKTLEIEGDIKILKGKKNNDDYIEILVADYEKWERSRYIYEAVCINGKEYEISGFGKWLTKNAEGQSLKRMWLN